jgi:hypothetical protein
MSPEQFAREYECSFAAGIEGSYYARALDEAAAQGRICAVRYDPRYPVITGWDLGFGDATGIWCAQPLGGEVRILRYIEDRQRKLADYHEMLLATGLKVSQDYLPHDAAAHEYISGRSREETLRSLGRMITVLPAVRKDDQIEAVRNLLPRCVFDAEGCADGLRHLRHYRVRPMSRGTLRTEGRDPLHDEHSHAADAFAQLAVGIREPARVKRAKEQVNEFEVAREERIKAAAARIKASEDAEILAKATALVEAELAVEREKVAELEQAKRNAEARAEDAKIRSAGIKKLAAAVAAYMVEFDCDLPRLIPFHEVERMRAEAGLV